MRKKITLTGIALLIAVMLPLTTAANFVPLRQTAYEHGATVEWDAANRAVLITDERGTQTLVVEEVGGYIQDGRTWIPQSVAETLFGGTQDGGEPQSGARSDYAIHGALHRVEHNGNVAYIFGSMHMAREEWFPLCDTVESAMRRADIFAFEYDLADPNLAEITVAAIEAVSVMPEGTTVADILTPEEFERYVYVISTFGIEGDALEESSLHENPSFVSFSMSQQVLFAASEAIGLDNSLSVDMYVVDFALSQGAPIIGLEPMTQQMEILYMPPLDVIAHIARTFPTAYEFEEAAAAEMESVARNLLELAATYETNNLQGLVDSFAEGLTDTEDIYINYQRERLYNFRSTYYANEIHRLLEETEEPTTFFVTVGVSHIIRSMGGDMFTDIVEQLAELGVTAVPMF